MLPSDTPPAQRSEMRKAFFAGSADMLYYLCRLADSEDEKVEESAIIALDAELEVFKREVTI